MKQFFCIFFCSLSLYATEYGPWISPLWEFEGRLGYEYSHTERVQSPSGSFKYHNNYNEVYGSLDATVWPEINIGAELVFVQSETLPFSYEVFSCTARRLLLDELAGDWINATIGLTVALPSARTLKDFNYAYHGYLNTEIHLALGKEFCHTCAMDWGWRLWGIIGMGVAERGSPWAHGLFVFDQALSRNLRLSVFLESLFGLGHNNIQPFEPFEGYASIHHQTVDLATALHYDLGIYATFSFLGYINLYAQNFTQHTFGFNATLLIPFGL